MKKRENYEDELASQIPEAEVADTQPMNMNNDQEGAAEPEQESFIGKRLVRKIGPVADRDEQKEFVESRGLSKIGENIIKNAEVREGWMEVDRALLKERNIFYPEDWRFFIKPAEVEAIRNWSTIDDENPNSIDDVFNEIIKCCLSIKTSMGTLSWGNINSWDRFFFILLIKEYTMSKGETKIEFEEECPECGNPITFSFNSLSLSYDLPDQEVMKYYDRETRAWFIDPSEFGVESDPIQLYLPTLDKDAQLKAYAIDKVRNKKKLNEVFLKFAQWMTPKISKNEDIAQRQIKELQVKFNAWDTDTFAFMDSVIKNIMVTPQQNITATCPTCGEESSAQIRFQNGIRSLFDVSDRFRKFGSK